jgi:hypothetical protein
MAPLNLALYGRLLLVLGVLDIVISRAQDTLVA